MHIPPTRQHGRSIFFGCAVAAWLAANGCASGPPPVHSMQDPQANFSAYQSFAWDTGQEGQAAQEPMTIVNGQIRAAIASELQRKGYAEASAGAKPDLLLRYETAAAEAVKNNPFRIGIGMGGVGNSGAAGVGVSSPSASMIREGTLVLRVIDPARNAEVWNGRVSRELGKDGMPDQALIQTAVADLLRKFPVPGSAPAGPADR